MGESFRYWLASTLVADGYISCEDEINEATSYNDLYCETSLEEADIENYKSDYEEYCVMRGVDPVFDIEDF